MSDKDQVQKKILIVEDDKFLLKIYGAKFQEVGTEVILLEDGTQALEMAKTSSPDLVLLDLILPRKDGFEVLAELASEPITKNIPVIVVTRLGEPSDVDRSKRLGAKEHLVKADHSIKELMNVLDSYLFHE